MLILTLWTSAVVIFSCRLLENTSNSSSLKTPVSRSVNRKRFVRKNFWIYFFFTYNKSLISIICKYLII